jgi:hypothetical protein
MVNNLKILSFGCGIQTVTMYFMSCLGVLPRLDYAIMGDTLDEKRKTYEYLEWLQKWQKENNGIPIIVNSKSKLSDDLRAGLNSTGQRFVSIPAYTKNADGSVGMIRRQCTSEYKIDPVNKAIRKIYGLPKGKWTPKTEVWIGITIDEASRMDAAYFNWQTKVYPFCGFKFGKKDSERVDYFPKPLTKTDCIRWLEEKGFPVPPKSACKYCPFQSDYSWGLMKKNEPEDFKEACDLDDDIRNGSKKGFVAPIYLHESCKPLREVNFGENQIDLFESDISKECKGYCMV